MSRKGLYPLVWTIVLVASALGTYVFFRTLMAPERSNPTMDRIQALINEADQLRKALDETRRG